MSDVEWESDVEEERDNEGNLFIFISICVYSLILIT